MAVLSLRLLPPLTAARVCPSHHAKGEERGTEGNWRTIPRKSPSPLYARSHGMELASLPASGLGGRAPLRPRNWRGDWGEDREQGLILGSSEQGDVTHDSRDERRRP